MVIYIRAMLPSLENHHHQVDEISREAKLMVLDLIKHY